MVFFSCVYSDSRYTVSEIRNILVETETSWLVEHQTMHQQPVVFTSSYVLFYFSNPKDIHDACLNFFATSAQALDKNQISIQQKTRYTFLKKVKVTIGYECYENRLPLFCRGDSKFPLFPSQLPPLPLGGSPPPKMYPATTLGEVVKLTLRAVVT